MSLKMITHEVTHVKWKHHSFLKKIIKSNPASAISSCSQPHRALVLVGVKRWRMRIHRSNYGESFTSRISLFFAKFFSELPHVEALLCHDKDQKGIIIYLTTGDYFSTPGSTEYCIAYLCLSTVFCSKSKQGNPIRSILTYKLGT